MLTLNYLLTLGGGRSDFKQAERQILGGHIEVINLKISQATSIEHFDQKVAAELERLCLKPLQMKVLPVNDDTNACAFLSVSIAEGILHESKIDDLITGISKKL